MSEDDQDFSHDSGFKNLVLDFPKETIRWLLPGAEKVFGKLKEISFPLQEMKKQKLSDKGRRTDVAMLVTFENGKALVPLIEHKDDKYTFSIYKLAHYALDLCEHFPGLPVIPIAVFTDQAKWQKDKEIQREIKVNAFGMNWLFFTFAKVKLSDIPAALIAHSTNPVKHILSPLMRYDKDKRLEVAADAYINLSRLTDPSRFEKYTDYIDKCAKIDDAERRVLDTKVHGEERVAMMKQYWYEQGQKDAEKKAEKNGLLKAARSMLAGGMDLPTILFHTGLSADDLKPDAPTSA